MTQWEKDDEERATRRVYDRFHGYMADKFVELKLAIFEAIPMPVWACDRDCRIVYWNGAAARVYDRTAEEAVGQDFVNLFVNESEKEQARLDCADIIDNSKVIRNMADDHDKHGRTINLVTHCFPLYGVGGNPALQVEISYQVADMDRLRDELHDLQRKSEEALIERTKMQSRLIDVLRAGALAALESAVRSRRDRLRERESSVDRLAVKKESVPANVAAFRREIHIARQAVSTWDVAIRKKIASAASDPELQKLTEEIVEWEANDV